MFRSRASRSVASICTLTFVVILFPFVLCAQDYSLRAPTLEDLMRQQGMPTHDYRLPSAPTIQMPNRDPFGGGNTIVRGIGSPPSQRTIDPRDYMQQFTTPQEIERQFERMDRADERRRWADCAKYNIHCVNMLRSLGGR